MYACQIRLITLVESEPRFEALLDAYAALVDDSAGADGGSDANAAAAADEHADWARWAEFFEDGVLGRSTGDGVGQGADECASDPPADHADTESSVAPAAAPTPTASDALLTEGGESGSVAPAHDGAPSASLQPASDAPAPSPAPSYTAATHDAPPLHADSRALLGVRMLPPIGLEPARGFGQLPPIGLEPARGFGAASQVWAEAGEEREVISAPTRSSQREAELAQGGLAAALKAARQEIST
jgi:hypothetical protein